MGQSKKAAGNTRRDFLSLFTLSDKKDAKSVMVKMLTADGKLVEIEKSVLEEVAKKQRSSNKEIYEWMQNPSKETNQ